VFSRLLIANRGEIALRIVRTCRELGVESVVGYSTADADSAAVRLADHAVHIGPAASSASYRNIPNLIEAARLSGADAIHPGYGFLSEDADFAEVCRDHGITFVGPDPESMHLAGSKVAMRARMAAIGVPVLPGSEQAVASLAEAEKVAESVGYPIILKASGGGGGRGIVQVRNRDELGGALQETTALAARLFGDPDVYIERLVEDAGHVEVQVLCDRHGAAVHLGERDCSTQRRRQKLVEESPSPRLTAAQREQVADYALRGARAIGYVGAGTMEFLVDGAGNITFSELNGRIQVEHPVTEMMTGVDIVAEQLRIAAGVPLSLSQRDRPSRGAAIECRINAEDPRAGFRPTPGRLELLQPAGGPFVRVDSGFTVGDVIPPHYDSLVAKLIVWGPTRGAAISRMVRALDEFRVEGSGVHTTIPLLRALISDHEFRSARHTTTYVDRFLERGSSF
jgi:acetyl-CoA carboxylase biotin carboxylase subunit